MFRGPKGLALDGSGNVFVADTGNRCIRRISPSGEVTTIAGGGAVAMSARIAHKDGIGTEAGFIKPEYIACSKHADGVLYVSDAGAHSVRKIQLLSDEAIWRGHALDISGRLKI